MARVGADPAERRRTALHEAAHATAGYLLGRPVSGVWLNEDGGAAQVATIREDADPATVREQLGQEPIAHTLDDIAVQLIGDQLTMADEVRVESRFIGEEAPNGDEATAIQLARRVLADEAEARALVEVARARARRLAADATFIRLVEELAPALLREGELDGDQLAAIFENEKGQHK
jgi:hypothetical protein